MAGYQDLRLLRYFVEVVRMGSIRGAAHSLSLSPAVISDALSQLESNLGVTLLHRSTRSMRLTEVGEEVFDRAADMVSAGTEALSLAQRSAGTPSGALRITLPGELALSWFPERLGRFKASYPEVAVTVSADDQPVDLAKSRYDIAIRAEFSKEPSKRPDAGFEDIDLCCVCAPQILPAPGKIEDILRKVGLIGWPSSDRDEAKIMVARNSGARRVWSHVSVPCHFQTSEYVVRHRFALQGFGASLLMRPTVEEDLRAGRLVSVSEQHDFGVAAVSANLRDKHPTAAAKAMITLLSETGRTE